MPTGSATSSASTCEAPITASVTGTRCRISCVDVDAADEGEAPVALQHGREPAEVALPDRVVQPELRAQRLRTSAGTFGLVASSSNGSPGASASTVNSTTLMPSRLGSAISRRRRT